MKNPVNIFRRLKRFISEDIWNLDIGEFSRAKARFIKYLKVLIITIKTFSAEKIGFQAVALSFFGTMSVVPFLAVVFAITDGLGLADKLETLLYSYFSNSQETINMVMGFANNIIDTAQSSAMGLVSALLFVWLVFWMMISVERVFNNVWRVRKSRNIFKRVSFYIAILLIAPFVIMLFFSGSIVYSNLLKGVGLDIDYFESIASVLAWILFYIVGDVQVHPQPPANLLECPPGLRNLGPGLHCAAVPVPRDAAFRHEA